MTLKQTKKPATKASSLEQPNTVTLHLIAGATGDLLHRLVSVGATQFSGVEFELVSHPMKDDLKKLQQALDRLTGRRPVVIHALPEDKAKQLVRSVCVAQRIPHFDATGPLLNFLADCVGSLPDNDLSRLHRFDATYQKRIEAMEFALEHDDSLGLATLQEADIVIVGVSRVSKSPTTLYLSSRGFKVANVSISPQTGFPELLSQIDQKKIVAFTTQPKRLQAIRSERLKRAGVASSEYDDLRAVIREVMDAEGEYRARGYNVIDVTDLTIEQTAAKILEKLKLSAL
jgi:regulator of PEP synthase PpsR (kinase-PPPase family)